MRDSKHVSEDATRGVPHTSGRRPWVAPEVRRMHAGAAESGIDPIVDDGPYSKGS